jgi:hypothetical protein
MIENAFPKLIELDELSKYGEPTIQIVRPHEFNKLAHVKAAGEALDYIKNVKPLPGKTIILVLAMTAGEFYGFNRNGDGWSERPMRIGKTVIGPDEVLPKHYQSFENSANVFRHHINKDPDKRIGQVVKAFYNWPMHRVELLLALDNGQAEDVVQEIENGKYPACSMGCKVKYDVCNICGNCAPSRKEYCDHAKYQLGETLSNGKPVGVWNPSPKFFDISMVRRPADRLGFMMKKVAEYAPEIRSGAELGEYVAEASKKVANLRKLSLIQKVLNGNITAAKTDDGATREVKQFNDSVAAPAAASMPPLDDNAIRQLIAYRPAEVLSTLASMGILLTTPEFIKYFVWKFAPNIDIPEEYLDRAVAAQHQVFSALAENPELLDSMEATGCLELSPENVNQALAEKMGSWVEKRSQHRDWIVKRAMFGLRQTTRDPTTGYTPGDFDLVSVRDPNTGKAYQTTKSVARRTEGLARKHQLGQILGGGALLAGGLALAPLRGVSGFAPLVGLSGVRQLAKARKGYPHIHAETGERVYLPSEALGRTIFPGTEMTEKQSSDVEFGMSDAVIKMAMEFAHRPQARNKKVAAIVLDEGGSNFDAAALKVGDAICL